MKALGTLLITALSLAAFGQEFPESLPEVTPAKILTAYIPQGFDSNDKTQVVVEGTFTSTCYKVGPHQVKVDPINRTITVLQLAYKYKGLCTLIPVKFHNTIDVGILPSTKYTVKDASDTVALGDMPVRPALMVESDDHLYAPSSEVSIDPLRRTVTVSGVFSNSCMFLRDLQVLRESHNVVVALPVLEIGRRPVCTDGDYPFQKTVSLPLLNDGRFLLHVRALNGQALNKLFQIGGGQ